MKKVFFITQAKGGAGKSMLTYLLALKNEFNSRTCFVDLDSSIMTSEKQLKFLKGKKPARFLTMNLLDGRDKLDRQLLFENLLQLTQRDYDEFYLDLGAPESDQLPSLFIKDYSALELKQIETELGSEFIFNIVIAGGGAYPGCTQYLQKMADALDGKFQVNIYINQATFPNHAQLIDEIREYAKVEKQKITSVILFGDFDVTTAPHKSILSLIEQGRGNDAYVFIEKIKIQKELSKL